MLIIVIHYGLQLGICLRCRIGIGDGNLLKGEAAGRGLGVEGGCFGGL